MELHKSKEKNIRKHNNIVFIMTLGLFAGSFFGISSFIKYQSKIEVIIIGAFLMIIIAFIGRLFMIEENEQ